MKFRDYYKKKGIDLSKKKEERAFLLGQLIMEARAFAQITQTELATRIGSKQSTISSFENGENEPSMEFLQRVAKAINTTLEFPKFAFMFERESRRINEFESVSNLVSLNMEMLFGAEEESSVGESADMSASAARNNYKTLNFL